MISRELLDEAVKTLRTKTKTQIDAETAAAWGARAVVAYKRFQATRQLSWYKAAVEYAGEALEHASGGDVLEEIRDDLERLTGKTW